MSHSFPSFYNSTRAGQSGAARTIINALWKWGLPRTCVPVLRMPDHRECTLNVYGSDAVVREDRRGVEKTPLKSGSLFALHTHRLSFISIDIYYLFPGIHSMYSQPPLNRTPAIRYEIVRNESALYNARTRYPYSRSACRCLFPVTNSQKCV